MLICSPSEIVWRAVYIRPPHVPLGHLRTTHSCDTTTILSTLLAPNA